MSFLVTCPVSVLKVAMHMWKSQDPVPLQAEEDEGEGCDGSQRTMMRYWRGPTAGNHPSSRRKSTPSAATAMPVDKKDGSNSIKGGFTLSSFYA